MLGVAAQRDSSAWANTWRRPATRCAGDERIAGRRREQLTEMCDASTRPLSVKAAKPQAVSIMPPIIAA